MALDVGECSVGQVSLIDTIAVDLVKVNLGTDDILLISSQFVGGGALLIKLCHAPHVKRSWSSSWEGRV